MAKKEEKKQDIVPPNRSGFIKFLQEVKGGSENPTKLTKRDSKFALMAELDGWQEFKDLVDNKIKRLRSLADYESAGRSLEELGLRFLVADLVSEQLEELVKRVDQSRELYEQEQKKKDNSS